MKTVLKQRNIVSVDGKIDYNEGLKAWSRIRLKKDLINEFPQLKERRSKFSFKIDVFRNQEELERAVKKLKNNKWEPLPVLMWFYKEE
ncbi:hypothetical protein GOV12_04520 [Candidatus Pacearchaeota archaeon]|nr:hypothetical protein [Candidatus Pacearchaeota archaeon]